MVKLTFREVNDMEMYRDGVEVLILPDSAMCMADDELRNPQEITICPLGNFECSGDCEYYAE